jgi:hypothetical protein
MSSRIIKPFEGQNPIPEDGEPGLNVEKGNFPMIFRLIGR